MLSLPIDILNIVSANLSFETLINMRLTHTYAQNIQKRLFKSLKFLKNNENFILINPGIYAGNLIARINNNLYSEYMNLSYNKSFNNSTGWARMIFLAYQSDNKEIIRRIRNEYMVYFRIPIELEFMQFGPITEKLLKYIITEKRDKLISLIKQCDCSVRFRLLNI